MQGLNSPRSQMGKGSLWPELSFFPEGPGSIALLLLVIYEVKNTQWWWCFCFSQNILFTDPRSSEVSTVICSVSSVIQWNFSFLLGEERQNSFDDDSLPPSSPVKTASNQGQLSSKTMTKKGIFKKVSQSNHSHRWLIIIHLKFVYTKGISVTRWCR